MVRAAEERPLPPARKIYNSSISIYYPCETTSRAGQTLRAFGADSLGACLRGAAAATLLRAYIADLFFAYEGMGFVVLINGYTSCCYWQRCG